MKRAHSRITHQPTECVKMRKYRVAAKCSYSNYGLDFLERCQKWIQENGALCELSMFQLAAEYCVPYELLAYKLKIMEDEGYDVPELPYEPDSRFLGGSLGGYDSRSDWR